MTILQWRDLRHIHPWQTAPASPETEFKHENRHNRQQIGRLSVDCQSNCEQDHPQRAGTRAPEEDGPTAEPLDREDGGEGTTEEDEGNAARCQGGLSLGHADRIDEEVGGIVGDYVVAVELLEALDEEAHPETPGSVDLAVLVEEALEAEFSFLLGVDGSKDVLSGLGDLGAVDRYTVDS